MSSQRIKRYRDFWPYNVGEHRRPGTRLLHFIGTSGAIILVALAAALGDPWLLPAALVAGYFFAWAGHILIERNRPATFTYPIFSLIGDLHMYGLMWLGRMNAHAKSHAGSGAPVRGTS